MRASRLTAVLTTVLVAVAFPFAAASVLRNPPPDAPPPPSSSSTPPPASPTDGKRATAADLPTLLADPAARQLFDEIVVCFPDGLREAELFDRAGCYEDIVVDAASRLEPLQLLNAVKALVAVRPNVLAACHNGGHKASDVLTKRFVDLTAGYDTQLAQMRRIMDTADDVCQNGYVHGFYDALGEMEPTMATFRAAATVCNEMTDTTVDCGHGLGHTAWISTKDVAKAAALCGVFTDEQRYRCDDGVIMYYPDLWSEDGTNWSADPRSPHFDAETYYRRSVEICNTWPTTRPGDPDPIKGCWIGIVNGLLFRPITTLTDYGDYRDYASEARNLAAHAERACMSLPPRGEEVCMGEWTGSTLYVTKNDPAAIRDFCSLLVKYRTQCIDNAIEEVANSKAEDTELGRFEN